MRPSLDRAKELLGDIRPLVIVEVGVQEAFNSIDMYDGFKPDKMFLVDPYRGYTAVSGVHYHEKVQAEYLEKAKARVGDRPNIEFMVAPSTQAASIFNYNVLDLVYLDGDHSFDAVMDDITAWWPRIKKGGILCGHDYDVKGLVLAVNMCNKVMKINKLGQQNFFEFKDPSCPEWMFIKREESK